MQDANERLKILDMWVDPLTRDEALERVNRFLNHGTRPHAVFASNPEKNFSVPADAGLHDVYRYADILLPDGIGMVLAARILYGRHFLRIPGSEFIFDICRLAAREGHGIFVYGAQEEVNAKACRILGERFPGLRIAGRANGYVKEGEMAELVRQINDSGAKVLFIALGSPKQEKWFAAHKGSLKNVRVCQCIGGTLDTITGRVKRAPEIWCRHNAEWLYRLLSEPKRLKRQKVLPLFAVLVMIEKLKGFFKAART
ncbi:MAG: putative N-acetylmannosaminyltransferase [Syntrophorhabdus sp. PtaU1.Bin058]|nr:MAG: putative N-acetylmannosaminyltransferase [Syntrophorhabdus sp. PtaU1.Bin058]